MTLRSWDVDSSPWRDYLVALTKRPGISNARATEIVDNLLDVIRDHGEDLDALISDLSDWTSETVLEAQRSEGRVARLEAALGVVDTVAGEVVE